MKRGITVTSYLITGDPEGVIFSYVSNWSGQAIKIPRNLFPDVKLRPEINRPGVYFLFGTSPENPDDKLVYVGEANNISERLVAHMRDTEKSFCESIICFTSKDDNLTVSHTKYLEQKIIGQISQSHEFTLFNRKDGNAISLSPMVKDEMETYFDNMKIILPTVGYNVLHEKSSTIKKIDRVDNEFYLNVADIKAVARLTSNGIEVKSGSGISIKETPALSGSYKNLRKTLLDKGIIIEKEGKLFFAEDYEFTSPSSAGATILGYSVNGRTFWKTKQGKTLKEVEDEILQSEDHI